MRWGVILGFSFGTVLLLLSGQADAIMQKITSCRTGQVCSVDPGGYRYCSIQDYCWDTWIDYPDYWAALPPRSNIWLSGGGGTDADKDAVVDCWKEVTDAARESSPFPTRHSGAPHNGVDIVSDTANYGKGAPVRSLGAGYVTEVGQSAANGLYVRVQQGDGMEATYIHLLAHNVQRNQVVQPGATLGTMNCTGNCGGPVGSPTRGLVSQTHVHIQLKDALGKLHGATERYGGLGCSANVAMNAPPGPGHGGGGNCNEYNICTIEP